MLFSVIQKPLPTVPIDENEPDILVNNNSENSNAERPLPPLPRSNDGSLDPLDESPDDSSDIEQDDDDDIDDVSDELSDELDDEQSTKLLNGTSSNLIRFVHFCVFFVFLLFWLTIRSLFVALMRMQHYHRHHQKHPIQASPNSLVRIHHMRCHHRQRMKGSLYSSDTIAISVSRYCFFL